MLFKQLYFSNASNFIALKTYAMKQPFSKSTISDMIFKSCVPNVCKHSAELAQILIKN